jgi:hypothetical protein
MQVKITYSSGQEITLLDDTLPNSSEMSMDSLAISNTENSAWQCYLYDYQSRLCVYWLLENLTVCRYRVVCTLDKTHRYEHINFEHLECTTSIIFKNIGSFPNKFSALKRRPRHFQESALARSNIIVKKIIIRLEVF